MRKYLEKLQDEYEQIALNQINRFEPDLSFEQFKEACNTVVANLKKLRISTEEILRDHLEPALADIKSISDEDEAALYATAQQLSSFETRQDPGLALKIYRALLERARSKNDDAKILKYLYWCGITQFFFYSHQSTKALEYFEEGASYADKYDTFEDKETRQYVHRCLGNTGMCLYSVNEPEKAMAMEELNFEFWNKLIFFEKDPDFPWLNYFLNVLNHRLSFLTRTVRKDPDSETKEAISKILDVSITMNKLYHKNREYYKVFGGTRYDYLLWDAQFLSGLISFDNLVENIEKRRAQIAPDDYSTDAMYVMIQLNSYLMFYASKMKKLSDRKDEIVTKISKDTIDYLYSIPKTMDTDTVNVYLKSLTENLNIIFDPTEHFDFILKMTTFRHIPTYAHSILVSKVAVLLTEELLARKPACFIGCLDITTKEDVLARADELYEFAKACGLCHDVGKIAGIDNPYMHIRVLSDEEYEIIKQHPEEGVKMLIREDGDILNKGYTEVIAGHHKYYDNSKGYPENIDISESGNKMMIDIIAAANSIVSATDHISKLYTDAKSLERVCCEIKEEAGSRYSPDIAGILDDEAVFSSIEHLLNEESLNAYYTAYLYAGSGGSRQ